MRQPRSSRPTSVLSGQLGSTLTVPLALTAEESETLERSGPAAIGADRVGRCHWHAAGSTRSRASSGTPSTSAQPRPAASRPHPEQDYAPPGCWKPCVSGRLEAACARPAQLARRAIARYRPGGPHTSPGTSMMNLDRHGREVPRTAPSVHRSGTFPSCRQGPQKAPDYGWRRVRTQGTVRNTASAVTSVAKRQTQ